MQSISLGRWYFPISLLLFAFSNVAAPLGAAEGKAAKLPNIVFIMADDLGSGDPRCYNAASKIPTPNMDKLAAAGMRFTDAHSPSAVCTPTRYGVLTGRYAWRTKLKQGVLWGYSPALIDTKRMTVASLLKKHGYATACVGKWHLGLGADTHGKKTKTDYGESLRPGPLDYGFDYFFGIPASLDMEPYVYLENDRVLQAPSEMIKARRDPRGVFWRGGPIAPGFKHIDVLPKITEKALAFIRKQAKTGKPFFLYFPLTAPHTPWLPTKEFQGRSKAGIYGDFVTQVDGSLGQVMKALDEGGLSDNTLIIFTSDNGAHWTPSDKKQYPHLANGTLRGQKADIWEGGHRIPFIARWPGIVAKGSISNETICLSDLMSTCAAIVGEKLPANAGEDSFNILPALKGALLKKPLRDATIHHSVSGVFAIRQGSWKLIVGRGSGGFSSPRIYRPKRGEPKGQLYNLTDDPSESKNLYQQHPEIVERLTKLLEQTKRQGRSRPAS